MRDPLWIRRDELAYCLTYGHGRWFIFNDLTGCVTPQAVEAVVFSNILGEDVDHNIAIVHKNPDGSFRPFNAQWPCLQSLEPILYALHHSLNLAMRMCGADHHVVGDGCQFADFKNDNICRFCFEGSLSCFEGFGSRIQDSGRAPWYRVEN